MRKPGVHIALGFLVFGDRAKQLALLSHRLISLAIL